MTSQRVSTLIFALAIASLSAVTRGAEGSLVDWYTKGIIPAVSYYYDIEAWAARTTNCVGTSSVACMACAMPLLDTYSKAGIAPIGVSNDWWFIPEQSATCGMCMKVYMYDTPALGTSGTNPLKDTVTEPWAYSAKVQYDEDVGEYYFIATIVEWFDRYQSSGLDITYPIFQQRDKIRSFGVWNVGLEPIPCPVGNNSLTLSFLDYSKPHPTNGGSGWAASDSTGVLPDGVAERLCDNQYDVPCNGEIVDDPTRNPVGWPKLKVWGSTYPIGSLTIISNGQEYQMKRSADDFWEPNDGSSNPGLDVSKPIEIRIQCLDGGPNASTHETTITPGKCLCKYQDPECKPCFTDIQC